MDYLVLCATFILLLSREETAEQREDHGIEDRIADEKKRGLKIRFEKFQWNCKPFHSFRSYDAHKSPIEHLEMWMTPENFSRVPQ